ncbi:MAG: site-2 protease family protein [Pedosphaera sp.]|nr:site-2 protease family protein [Pedosphaera sp.]
MADILNIIYVVAVVFLLFGAAIFVHEFGHFWVALKRGLKVEEFAIGFGPIIWSKTHEGILYSIRAIPAGGFVKLPQMLTSEAIEGKPEGQTEGDEDSENEDSEPPEPVEELPPVSPLSKILVAFAGPLMNVIFAILIAVFIWLVGIPKPINEPVVGYVGEKSKEYKIGARPGDRITNVNGEPIETWQDVVYAVLDSEGETVAVQVQRGEEQRQFDLPAGTWSEGIRRIRLDNQDLLEVMSFETPSLLGDVGFKPGDVVLSVNGQKAYSQYQLLDLLMADAGQMKTVRVTRGDQEVELPFETPDVAGVAVEQVVTEDEDGLSTPASKADVQAGDVIKSAAGVRVTSTRQLVDIIQAQDNKEFELDLLRGDKGIQVSITPKDNRLGVALKQDIGLVFKPEPIRYSKELAHPSPAAQIGDVLDKIAITFKALGRGKESGVGAKDLSGPVGIFGMLAIQVNHDLRLALSFLVLLNINLAILNLLPVPVLDGGHILLSIIEWIRKEPVSVKIQEWATTAFAALLLCFFVYVTFADVKRVPLLHDIFNRDTEKVEQPVGSGE